MKLAFWLRSAIGACAFAVASGTTLVPLPGQEKASTPQQGNAQNAERLPLKDLQPSPSNKATVKKDGVEMTFEVELDEKKDTTDLLIKWELRNTGPRPTLDDRFTSP